MTGERVLVIDDEPDMLENCRRMLRRSGLDVRTLQDATKVREVTTEFAPDVLLLDLRMPEVDGMQVMATALADDPLLPVVIMTGYATVASAVSAVRDGAFDYLAKPFSKEQLLVTVERAVRYRGLQVENRELRKQVPGVAGHHQIIGDSPAMARVLEPLLRVAATSANVLITGESGTGKELVARSVHENSDRSGPFVPIDCAALPEHLLESELFGHERGAFTGAVQQKVGLMIRASKGTLFLDEIGEMSQGLQAKLLRVLEERLVRPVGSTREIPIDVRLVAATNVDLEAAVDNGTFRVVHFLDEFARASNKELPRVAPEAWEPIERYAWPGNVRELRNLAQRLVVFDADARITTSDLPAEIRGTGTPVEDATPLDVPYEEARDAALRAFRKSYLRDLLDRTAGNVSQAARAAGVSRRTVHRWMIEDEE